MFNTLNDLNTTYKAMWKVMLAGLTAAVLMVIGVSWFARMLVKDARETAYVISEGQVLRATAKQIGDNRVLEAEAQVRAFHSAFFSLIPDDVAIKQGVYKTALSMADSTAWLEYESLRKSGYYSNLIRDNISQTIRIDSVYIDPSISYAKTFAVIRIISPATITTRRLISECNLRADMRTESRPHGYMIENWRVIQNDDIRKEPR